MLARRLRTVTKFPSTYLAAADVLIHAGSVTSINLPLTIEGRTLAQTRNETSKNVGPNKTNPPHASLPPPKKRPKQAKTT